MGGNVRIEPDIKYLFEPRNVAVIGASHNKNKIGHKVVQNILMSNYGGDVFPINPRGGEILGLKVYPSIEDVNEDIDVDLAIIAIPAKYVFEEVRSCAQKKVKYIIIITSGFSEIGNIREEHKIVEFAHNHGMRILGPNVFGIYSSMGPINATFGPSDVKAGTVALISQSGAIGVAMFGKTKAENIGLSTVVSVGNKSDINEADLMEYLVSNKQTKVILMYIEGIKDGEKLMRILNETTTKKPVIVIKSGRSKRGALAAASHTGSLAGADEIFDDIMNQCGVLRAESIDEALIWCKILSNAPKPKGENNIIITNGGGIGVMAADAAEKYGVNLYDDLETMKKIFSAAVPEFGSVKNPVDLTGQANIPDYELALKAAIDNEDIHSIICLGCETAILDTGKISDTVENFFKKYKRIKPMVFSFLGGAEIERTITELRYKGIPIYSEVYDAISSFGAVYSNYRNMNSETGLALEPEKFEINTTTINKIIHEVKSDNRTFLLSSEATAVMEAAGFPMPKSKVARSIDEAVDFAEGIGYPVVMKVVSKDILHKSDVGGVALDLMNSEEVLDAYQAIIHNSRLYRPDARVTGVEVAEMITKGTETIIGARHDISMGPIIMFGLGGIYVEVMKDVSFRALPIPRFEALSMIKSIKSYPLLLGVRGEKKKDINQIIEIILRLGNIILECPSISDIEINPLFVYDEGKGVKAVDARILISDSGVLDDD